MNDYQNVKQSSYKIILKEAKNSLNTNMKRITFSILILMSFIELVNAQSTRFAGTWLATEGNMSYKITFRLDTIIQDEITATYLLGDITYIKNGKIIREIKTDKNKARLFIYIESNIRPEKNPKISKVLATYNDLDRNSESYIDLTISDNNNSFQWEYNEMVSHEELNTKLWKRNHGIQENQPMDVPKKLTFIRVLK